MIVETRWERLVNGFLRATSGYVWPVVFVLAVLRLVYTYNTPADEVRSRTPAHSPQVSPRSPGSPPPPPRGPFSPADAELFRRVAAGDRRFRKY